jgi:hypothetical protein
MQAAAVNDRRLPKTGEDLKPSMDVHTWFEVGGRDSQQSYIALDWMTVGPATSLSSLIPSCSTSLSAFCHACHLAWAASSGHLAVRSWLETGRAEQIPGSFRPSKLPYALCHRSLLALGLVVDTAQLRTHQTDHDCHTPIRLRELLASCYRQLFVGFGLPSSFIQDAIIITLTSDILWLSPGLTATGLVMGVA